MKYYRSLRATLSNFCTVSMEINTCTNNAQAQRAQWGYLTLLSANENLT